MDMSSSIVDKRRVFNGTVAFIRRLTPHNLAGLSRYLALRLRYRRLRVGLFYIGSSGDIEVGPRAHVSFGPRLRIMRNFTGRFYGRVTIGDDVFFNEGCHVVVLEGLSIGNHCLFGEMVAIHDENHIPGRGPVPIVARGVVTSPIVIGNNVWVGAKSTILSGVHIGDNAVIGANTVVTRDVPPNVIVAGNPTRIIREL